MTETFQKFWRRTYEKPIKSRKEYFISSTFFLLWITLTSGDLLSSIPNLRTGQDLWKPITSGVLFFGSEVLMVLVVTRRLLYLRMSLWWAAPIVGISSIGAVLIGFNKVSVWFLPLVYFLPQLPLLTGKTEEPPRAESQFPRVRYALMVLVLVDLPLGHDMQTATLFWAYAAVCGPVMIYLSCGRFRDIGFPAWWALPYTLIALSPYLQFYLHPVVNRWFVALSSVLLQTPAMFLRKGWAARPPKPESS